MANIPLPAAMLPGRTVTLYDSDGNAVEVFIGRDGAAYLAADPRLLESLDKANEHLEKIREVAENILPHILSFR